MHETEWVTTFAAKTVPSEDKLRGGYYTPEGIARFLADWTAVAGPRLLEPSCGDGAIFRELLRTAGDRLDGPVGVELNAAEAEKAAAHGGTVVQSDFFAWFTRGRHGTFDGVAGNPPFIRFGNWPDEARQRAFDLMRSVGLKPTKLTNAWVPFTVAAVLATRAGGRVGLVLPAELLQVTYAAPLRAFLTDNLSRATVVSFRRLVFPGILQEVVLLLGERGPGPALMHAVEVDDASALAGLATAAERSQAAPALHHDNEKWTKYFLEPKQIELLRALRARDGVRRLGDFASVDVGVVTGRNSFFVMTLDEATERGVDDFCVPLVSKSNQVPGIRYTEEDLEKQSANGARSRLLTLPQEPLKPRTRLARYVKQGEDAGVHEGYKCSIRKFWWSVPSVSTPDGFMLRQIHTHPRLSANHTSATSTDTVHRVRTLGAATVDQLACGALNSLTFASAEVAGRSYGGGILELEPSEAESLLVPNVEAVTDDLVAEVDEHVRSSRLQDALALVDSRLLVDGLGLSRQDVSLLQDTWSRLRDRRAARGRSAGPVQA
jgi:adenine-specific DNA methylase